jgi:hypothetical protein
MGGVPTPQAHNNPGFDVQSRRGQDVRFIEVKGIDGEWTEAGVPLSSTQFDFAKQRGPGFWLYVVEHVNDPTKLAIHTIQDPASKVTQFRFDHGWQAYATKERGFAPLVPREGLWLRGQNPRGEVIVGRILGVRTEGSVQMLRVELASNGHVTGVAFHPLRVELFTHQPAGTDQPSE